MSDALNTAPKTTPTLNAFLAASTYTRIAAALLGILSALHGFGWLEGISPEMIEGAVDQAQKTAQEGARLYEMILGIAGAAGLWGIGDTQRSSGKADLTIGNTVVSKAGSTP